MTYNQEKYVREAVRGLLAQTYDPLEVVISDDCSSDRTWAIVLEEVERYKKTGGHHQVVLNRNERNLGIAANVRRISELKHGIMSVACGGDDISFPNRVERIVEAWISSGRTATLIHHGYYEIDEDGRRIRVMPPRSARVSLGATCAYVNDGSGVKFPRFADFLTIEDQVLAKRALMRGPELRIQEPLMSYRVGLGISTKFHSFRDKLLRDGTTMVQSCRQLYMDLDAVRGKIHPDRYELVKKMVDELMLDYRARVDMAVGRSARIRFAAIRTRIKNGSIVPRSLGFVFRDLMFVLPAWIGDPIIDAYERIRRRRNLKKDLKSVAVLQGNEAK